MVLMISIFYVTIIKSNISNNITFIVYFKKRNGGYNTRKVISILLTSTLVLSAIQL